MDNKDDIQIEIEIDDTPADVAAPATVAEAAAPSPDPASPPSAEVKEEGAAAPDPAALLRAQIERQQRQLDGTQRDAQAQVVQARHIAVTSALDAANAQLSELQRDYAQAMDAGEWVNASKLNAQIAVKSVEKVQLEQNKEMLDAYIKNPPRQPQAPADPVEAMIAQMGAGLSSRAQSWLREHPEVASKPALRSKIAWLHDEAQERGHTVDSDGYYAFINEQMGYTRRADPAQPTPPEKPREKTPMPAAPVSRDTQVANGNLTGTVVKLTAGERAAATDGTITWPYDDPSKGAKKGEPIGVKEYARRKLALQQQGAYDKSYTQQ